MNTEQPTKENYFNWLKLSKEMEDFYKDTPLLEKLNNQKKLNPNTKPHIVFSDYDWTFKREGMLEETNINQELADQAMVPTIIVSGRNRRELLRHIIKDGFKLPEAISSSVGTELWILKKTLTKDQEKEILKEENLDQVLDLYEADPGYEKNLISKGYDKKSVLEKSRKMLDKIYKNHPNWNLGFQPNQEMVNDNGETIDLNTLKVSFNFYLPEDEKDESEFQEKVASEVARFFPEVKIIVCSDDFIGEKPGKKVRFNLDLLPVGKDYVVKYMREHFGTEGLVAGDSGNDLEMLLYSGAPASVLVGGSKPEAVSVVNKNIPEFREGRRVQRFELEDGTTGLIYVGNESELGPIGLRNASRFFSKFKAMRDRQRS
ncbi:MAG: hypothetical protein GF335_01155 [Candidatus Moranbacteria bacterium]|nr:hypothetical protein [Candidatus Moranbacteria bacterium]